MRHGTRKFPAQATAFQSTTRLGATWFESNVWAPLSVSIHAPVWVRHCTYWDKTRGYGFQSTHPFGCDLRCMAKLFGLLGFNPRTRLGATPAFFRCRSLGVVSIHAPVWVRRQATIRHGPRWPSFNPRTRLGATHTRHAYLAVRLVSIHAPVWVRRNRFTKHSAKSSFNPRTRLGATWIACRMS